MKIAVITAQGPRLQQVRNCSNVTTMDTEMKEKTAYLQKASGI